MTEYEAKSHYQDKAVAERYNSQYEAPLSCGNFRAKFVGAGEERAFRRMLAPLPRTARVLDVAAGTGRYTQLLLEAGFEVMSSDVSPQMLEFARSRGRAFPKYLGAKEADAAALPFEDREFDGVTCIRLYQRVPAEVRQRMIREVRRVTKSWAILFFGVTTPWLAVRQAVRNAVIRGRANNPNAATLDEVRRELRDAGLRLEEQAWVMPVLASGIIVRVTVIP